MLTDRYIATLDKHPASGRVVARRTVDSEPELGTIVTMGDDSEIQMTGPLAASIPAPRRRSRRAPPVPHRHPRGGGKLPPPATRTVVTEITYPFEFARRR
jgi:hypothetical protein